MFAQGEVCFPGGMKDPSDHSLMETALREAMEEVNLLPDQVEVVGALPPIYRSISSNHITLVTPFVAILSREAKESLQLVPNEEVEQIFWVPLHLFVSGGPYHSPVNLHFAGDGYSDNQFSLNHLGIDCVVWGMTAALSISVASIVLQIPVHFPFTILLSSRVEEEASWCILHVAPLRLPTGSSQEDGVSSSQSVRAKL